MKAHRVTASALRLASTQPSTWLTCLLLLTTWPALSVIGRIGIRSTYIDDSRILYELAIMSMALGVLRGVALLGKLSRPLSFLHSGPTVATRTLALGSFGALYALVAAAPMIAAGHSHAIVSTWGTALRLVLVLSSLVALGNLFLRDFLPAGSAPWLLGASMALAPVLLPHPLPMRSLALLAGALYSAAWLLDHPPGRFA